MLKDIRLTLYDFFAYFFPGALALAAGAAAIWTGFHPNTPGILYGYDATLMAVVIGIAYVVGHLIQAIGNILEHEAGIEDKALERARCHPLYPLVKRKLLSALPNLRISKNDNEVKVMVSLCETANALSGIANDKDLFHYRKDFYRGMVIAFGAALITSLFIAWEPGLMLRLNDDVQIIIDRGTAIVLSLGALLGTLTALGRYRRFARYKVEEPLRVFGIAQYMPKAVGSSTADESGADADATNQIRRAKVVSVWRS